MKRGRLKSSSRRLELIAMAGVALGATLVACGGGGGPLGNPPDVENPPVTGQQKLSFEYFQRCVNPIFNAPLTGPSGTTNTCAGSGCHDTVSGTGGAFRVVPAAQIVDLSDPASTPDLVRSSDMYKNFYSALGEVVMGSPTQSRIVAKPLLLGILHGGGQVFANDQDPNVKRIEYWITHPMPQGQDEFSAAGNNLFTPADPKTGTCNQ